MLQQSDSSRQEQDLRIYLEKISGSYAHTLSSATVQRFPAKSAGDEAHRLYKQLAHLRRYLSLHHQPTHWLPPLSDTRLMLMLGRTDDSTSDPQALCFAAMSGDTACVDELIQAGADINGCDDYGITPVMYATLFGHHDLVKYLIEQNANIHHLDNQGRTLYHCAAFAYDTQLMERLCAEGLDPKARDNHHCTAEHYIAWGGQKAGVRAIQSRTISEAASSRATPDITLKNALMVGGMRLLSPEKKDESPYDHDQTLVHWITIPLLSDAFWELKRHDFFSRYDYNRQSLFIAARHGHVDAFEHLLGEAIFQAPVREFTRDQAVKSQDERGNTALHYFAMSHSLEGVRYCHEQLEDKSQFFKILDKDGGSVLHAAASSGCVEIMRWVVAQAEGELKWTNELGQTPLHAAAVSNNPDMIDECLTLGCQLDAKDAQGLTALDHAHAHGCLPVIQALHSRGAMLTQPNAMMRNPNPNVIHWLLLQQDELPLSSARYKELSAGMLAVNNHAGCDYCRQLVEVEKSLKYFSNILSTRPDKSLIDHAKLSELVASVKELLYENSSSSHDIAAECDQLAKALPGKSTSRFNLGRPSQDSAVKKLTTHLETLKQMTHLSIYRSPETSQKHVVKVDLK